MNRIIERLTLPIIEEHLVAGDLEDFLIEQHLLHADYPCVRCDEPMHLFEHHGNLFSAVWRCDLERSRLLGSFFEHHNKIAVNKTLQCVVYWEHSALVVNVCDYVGLGHPTVESINTRLNFMVLYNLQDNPIVFRPIGNEHPVFEVDEAKVNKAHHAHPEGGGGI